MKDWETHYNKKLLISASIKGLNLYVRDLQSLFNIFRGISNLEIKSVLQNLKNDDINKNFIGVFPSEKINKFVSFHKIMKTRGKKYPFLTSNMHRSDEKRTQLNDGAF